MPPSSIAGCRWIEKWKTYHASVSFNKRSKYIGSFKLESEAAAAIAKFKIDGISPVKPPTSLITGISKNKKKWAARARFKGGPWTLVGSWYKSEKEADAAARRFETNGIKPPLKIIHSSLFKGVGKNGNKWRAHARFEGGPQTCVGSWYNSEEEAGEAARKFEHDGIKPPVKGTGNKRLDIMNICPGHKGCKTPCNRKTQRHLWSFHDEQDELVGICCSLMCLDGRYQSPAFLKTYALYRETRYRIQRENHQSHVDTLIALYQDGDVTDRDIPFTLEEQNTNAALYYTSLIRPLVARLQCMGIARQCALGIQYANYYRAKTEGMNLLARSGVKRDLARCGVIAKATKTIPPEAKCKRMISMVIVSCAPGRSLIEWEAEMQRLVLQDASNGTIQDVCLMFLQCRLGGGGGAKYADVPGYRAQLVLSLWVPTRWKQTVEKGFSALVAEMEKTRSFPDVLRGQFMPATDDPMGMKLPYAPFEVNMRKKNDAQVRTFLKAFKEMGSKSIKRVDICQRIVDERSD